MALGVSLTTMVVTAAIAAALHTRRGTLGVAAPRRRSPGALIVGRLGAVVAGHLTRGGLRRHVNTMLLLIAARIVRGAISGARRTTAAPRRGYNAKVYRT